MGRTSVLFGLAVLVACAFGAAADDTRQVTDTTLPAARPAAEAPSPLRPSEGMPRYATMVPPGDDSLQAPIAAPTDRVTVAQAPAIERAQPQPVADPPRAARSAADERVVMSALRPSEDSSYRLGSGDKLHVTVFNEADLSGDFTIDGQGYVRLPLVGPIQAAGLTSLGLESRIADAFVVGGLLLSPRVSVEIVAYRPFYILGEVAKPGEYAYVNAMSAPNAIALAGGYTDRATQSTIWVRRQGEFKERELRADETTRIYPGDVVRVERSAYWSVMTLLAPLISPFATTAYILK